jgi:hypothetical protein
MAKEYISKKWIQGAISKPGSFTAYCKKLGYSGVTSECIQRGLKSNDPTTRKRASLARTLRRMH